MSVLAWSHFGLAADSWELSVLVPFSLGVDVFMMCRTIVHPLLQCFLEEGRAGCLYTLYEGVEKLCFTQCCD